MTAPTLHVVFSPSAAVDLARALRLAGRTDRVVAMFDDLSFGPIAPPDPALRTRWVADTLGYDDWADVGLKMEAFWAQALGHAGRTVAWMSRRSAADYAGYLEFLWRIGEAPCDIADLTDTMVVAHRHDGTPLRPRLALCLALLPTEQILSNGLLDRPVALDPARRAHDRGLWQWLRAENAPLRVLDETGLVSAPLSFFDELLLSCAATQWRKAARVIGEALATSAGDTFHQAGDLLLASRLAALAESGRLDWRGDRAQLRSYEVRLPVEPVIAAEDR